MFTKMRKAFTSLVQDLYSIGSNFVQCIVGKILVRSCGLISLPLLTFYFTREEMGIYQLLVGGLGIFVEAATLGTRQYFAVEYFKRGSLYFRLVLILKNLWVFLRISSLLFSVLCLFLLFYFDFAFWCVCLLMFAQSYLNIFNELYLVLLQFQMRFFRYNLTSFLFAALQMSLVLLAVSALHLQLTGLACALFLSELIFFIYFICTNKNYISILSRMKGLKKIDSGQVIELLKKSWIFVPSTLSFWLLLNIDQWMLGGVSGLDAVGLYAFAGKFPLLFDYLLSSTLILVYTPYLYKGLKGQFYRFGNQNTALALVLVGVSCLGYCASVWMFPMGRHFISENFYASLDYIPPLIFAAGMRLATHVLQLLMKYQGFASFPLWSNILSAGVNAVLNAFWIPHHGIHGCLMATVLSFVFMFGINLAFHCYLVKAASCPPLNLKASE